MIGTETLNNLLNGNTFNHRIFAEISPPNDDDPIIDLSSGGEADEYEILNVAATANRKRHHHSAENLTTNNNNNNTKRKHQDNVQLYNDSQKNRNRNVPLKKRGASNREEELNFLNLIASEDSNQAQNLKVERSNESAMACDSTISSSAPLRSQSRLYHDLEPKDKRNDSSTTICNCFECFPSLGASSSRIKCKKIPKIEEPSSSSSSSASNKVVITAGAGSSASSIIDSMIAGPSGLQKSNTNNIPVKKRNYCESDDDYDSDEPRPSTVATIVPVEEDDQVDEKTNALTAPHLQLDWLSDSSQGEEDDDDVIFVNDRSEPIDLTADSDESDNDARANALQQQQQPPSSSIDAASIENRRSTGDEASEISNHGQGWQAPPARLIVQRSHPTGVNVQRAPILPAVSIPISSHNSITTSPHNIIINIPTPPVVTPLPTRPINFHEMITGNDVMLFDSGVQNFASRPAREATRSRTTMSSPVVTIDPRSENPPSSQSREASQNTHPHHNQNNHHTQPHHHHHHHRRHFYHLPSPLVYDVQPNSENPSNAPQAHSTSQQSQHQQQQNCRQHVGRCPFMTEGHHYNRPRRLPREFYPMANGRPYVVHEDLWRRQYQEQEIRRHYWSPSFNETAPEVQVLRPPPATPHMDSAFPHRLVASLGGENPNNNPNGNPSNDIINRFDRFNRMQRYRRAQW